MNQIKLQQANQNLLAPYTDYFEYAVTLTVKSYATLHNEHLLSLGQGFVLTDDILKSTMRYFTANLTKFLYGNHAKHKNKQHYAKPLLFFVVEGANSDKREHLHIALGNVPEHKKANIEQIIKQAWARCDFAHQQIRVEPIYNAAGWTDYITKEIGFENNDALSIVDCVIPQVYRN
jgi:hypothetical protein